MRMKCRQAHQHPLRQAGSMWDTMGWPAHPLWHPYLATAKDDTAGPVEGRKPVQYLGIFIADLARLRAGSRGRRGQARVSGRGS